MQAKLKVMIARFPGNYSEHPHSAQWVMETAVKAARDSRVEGPTLWWRSSTPITMVRNLAVHTAAEIGADLLLMIDSDMGPDFDQPNQPSPAKFWDSTFNFMYERRLSGEGPCIVAAPYCGPAPLENIYVFLWRQMQGNTPPSDPVQYSLQQYTREETCLLGGIKEVAAIPTGLCMIDMRLFTGWPSKITGQEVKLHNPYFYYEYKDERAMELASTEDVTFSRDASLIGCPCYCNWDAWALHYKLKPVGRPYQLTPAHVTEQFVKSLGLAKNANTRNCQSNKDLTIIGKEVLHGRVEDGTHPFIGALGSEGPEKA